MTAEKQCATGRTFLRRKRAKCDGSYNLFPRNEGKTGGRIRRGKDVNEKNISSRKCKGLQLNIYN